jgi:hypothetical protein
MARLAHFSIPADDCDRAMAFYRGALDWRFRVGWHYTAPEGERTYWLIETGVDEAAPVQGGLTHERGPVTGMTLVFEVDSLDECVARIRECGGEIIQPRAAIPGVCWFASCRDTEGNLFAVSEPDPQAASVG